jgi:hypothetical protein
VPLETSDLVDLGLDADGPQQPFAPEILQERDAGGGLLDQNRFGFVAIRLVQDPPAELGIFELDPQDIENIHGLLPPESGT